MYFEESGDKNGRLVIFLHGVGSSSRMWSNHFEELKDYHCVAPDLPGHGRSNQISWTTLEDVSEQLFNGLKKYKHERLDLVGLSLGGSLIIKFLSKYGDIVDNAIIDGAGIFPIPAKTLVKAGVRVISPFLKFNLINKALAGAIGVNDKNFDSFKSDLVAIQPYSFRAAFCEANDQHEPMGLDRINTRTLFVAGEKEPNATKESNRYLAKKMMNAASYLMPNEGHGWLAKEPGLHVKMTRAWLKGESMPSKLVRY